MAARRVYMSANPTEGEPMKRVMVRYKVSPDRAAENEQLVRAVYEELHRTGPADMRYATFQLDDGVSFVHVHTNERSDGVNVLTAMESFKKFEEGMGERCEEAPVVTELREIGSYRFD